MRTSASIFCLGTMPLLFLFLLCSWGTQLTSASMMSCEAARHKCAFASACTKALQTYFARCDEFLKNDPTKCPDSCLFALVALTSTHDGKRMLDVSILFIFVIVIHFYNVIWDYYSWKGLIFLLF